MKTGCWLSPGHQCPTHRWVPRACGRETNWGPRPIGFIVLTESASHMADLLMAMVHGAGAPSAASLSCLHHPCCTLQAPGSPPWKCTLATPGWEGPLLAWKHVRDLPWGVLIAVGIRFSSMPQLPSFAENSVPLSVAQACTLLPGGGAAQRGTGGSWGQRSPRSGPLERYEAPLYITDG